MTPNLLYQVPNKDSLICVNVVVLLFNFADVSVWIVSYSRKRQMEKCEEAIAFAR